MRCTIQRLCRLHKRDRSKGFHAPTKKGRLRKKPPLSDPGYGKTAGTLLRFRPGSILQELGKNDPHGEEGSETNKCENQTHDAVLSVTHAEELTQCINSNLPHEARKWQWQRNSGQFIGHCAQCPVGTGFRSRMRPRQLARGSARRRCWPLLPRPDSASDIRPKSVRHTRPG